jgi:hypothetical protein
MHGCIHSWTIHVLNQEWDYEMAEVALECVGAHVPTALIPACKPSEVTGVCGGSSCGVYRLTTLGFLGRWLLDLKFDGLPAV